MFEFALKPGGELYLDAHSNRRVPISLQKNEALWGEGLSELCIVILKT
jgi:hypothetical protein